MTKKIVALLKGGWSAERDVSLEKSRPVETALRAAGYEVTVIDVSRNVPALVNALTALKPDVVFNNLYGRGGEDGQIQSLLEMLEIPYTHSGVTASAIGMDKPRAKIMAASMGVPVADAALISRETALKDDLPLAPPFVVKPPNEGSSVGIHIINTGDEARMAFEAQSWVFGEYVMIERYIPGRELTVAVLDGEPQAVTEIVAQSDFFDYKAKYQSTDTSYHLPADIPEDVMQSVLEYARNVYNCIGCRGLARCDFRYNDTGEGPAGLFFLEINTQPGLTPESIAPAQIIWRGMSFQDLCAHLVETATCDSVSLSCPDELKKDQNKQSVPPAEAAKRGRTG